MKNLDQDKIEFLFNQFTERCEDHRSSVISIGQNVRFLFGLYLAAAVGSFGYALTIPEMSESFVFASVYFSVLSVYLLVRGFGMQNIPQKGLHPDELEDDSGFIYQDLDMMKLGISESLKEDINTYKYLSDHLAKVGYYSVIMAVSFPFLTIFSCYLPELKGKISCLLF